MSQLYKLMDPEIARLMEEHDVDEDTAEKAQELIDDGLEENEAIEIAEEYNIRSFMLI